MKFFKENIMGWQTLGKPGPSNLTGARLQIHWAAQVVAAAGISFAEPKPDDSHTSLSWLVEQASLAGHFSSGEKLFRAAIQPGDLTLMLLNEKDDLIEQFNLDGCTLDEGYEWLISSIQEFTKTGARDIKKPAYEMPPHPVATGAPFSRQPISAFDEMARWFANSDLVLSHIDYDGASPVRCWPHHFDIATLLLIDSADDSEDAQSVGVGMAPGDNFHPEPYWYVSPWPYPKTARLPDLAGGGQWHTENAFMATLPGSAFVDLQSPEDQLERVLSFLQSALEGSFSLLA